MFMERINEIKESFILRFTHIWRQQKVIQLFEEWIARKKDEFLESF